MEWDGIPRTPIGLRVGGLACIVDGETLAVWVGWEAWRDE
jgi:hypothetical protein